MVIIQGAAASCLQLTLPIIQEALGRHVAVVVLTAQESDSQRMAGSDATYLASQLLHCRLFPLFQGAWAVQEKQFGGCPLVHPLQQVVFAGENALPFQTGRLLAAGEQQPAAIVSYLFQQIVNGFAFHKIRMAVVFLALLDALVVVYQ